jgi:hypothetical protein
MNASFLTNPSSSFRHTVACVAAMALMTTLGACDKKTEGPEGTTTTTTAPAAAAAAKKTKTTLKLADVKSAYRSEIDSMSKMKDPMDKKVEAFIAKIGKPSTDTGRKKTWYALDGDKCTRVEIDNKDGSILEASAEKAECGM